MRPRPLTVHNSPDMDEVSASTRAAIHRDEARELTRKLRNAVLIPAGFLVLWAATGFGFRNPLLLFLGWTSVPLVPAFLEWRRHRAADPVKHHDERIREKQARETDEQETNRRVESIKWGFTSILVAILAAIATFEVAIGGAQRTVEAVGLIKPAGAAEWWRVVTAAFVHGSPMHLAMNVSALVVMGRFVEAFLSRWRLPLVYAASGVAGSLMSLWLEPRASLGASGAIMGIAGYLAAIGYRAPELLPRSARAGIIGSIAATAWLGLVGAAFIDNAAHAGGLLAGAAIGFATASAERRRNETGRSHRWMDAAGVICALLIFAASAGTLVAMNNLKHRSETPITLVSVERLHDRGGQVVARLTNSSNQPLEAYNVSIVVDGRTYATMWRDDCCFEDVSKSAPLPPGESRDVLLPAVTGGVSLTPARIKVVVAIFEDGSFQGLREEFDLMRARRKAVVEEADYWLNALNILARRPVQDIVGLNRMIADRTKNNETGRLAVAAFGIDSLLKSATSRPSEFWPLVGDARQTVLRIREKLVERGRRNGA